MATTNTTINNFCIGCGQSIRPTETSCPRCVALQGGDISTPLIIAQSPTFVGQTHLFLATPTEFKVRWTYWVWLVLAASSFVAGGAFSLFGCGVMPYLIVSTLVKRKQWNDQKKLINAKP